MLLSRDEAAAYFGCSRPTIQKAITYAGIEPAGKRQLQRTGRGGRDPMVWRLADLEQAYAQWVKYRDGRNERRRGKPRRLSRDPDDRFWSRVDKSGECWIWTAGKNSAGYGQFSLRRRTVYAHRYAYERLRGPIPDGLELDHLCRVRACVNPAHLEPVTRRENQLRGESPIAQKARWTHCPRGHEFTPENTYYRPDGDGRHRLCKTCARIRDNRRRGAP